MDLVGFLKRIQRNLSLTHSHTPVTRARAHTFLPSTRPSRALSLPLRRHDGARRGPGPRGPATDSLGDVQEDVGAAVGRGDEAVALGPTEAFADSSVDGAL